MPTMRTVLFQLAVATAHADPDTLDLNSMLQASVVQHARPATKPVQLDATHVLLQSVTNVAKSLTPLSSGTMAPEAVETAISAASSAVSSMLPALDTEHGAEQHEVDRQFAEIGACSDHAVHGMIATSQHDVSLQAQELALNQCNEDLATAHQEQTRACDAWTSHFNVLSGAEPACGHTSTPEQFYENFQTWKAWVLAEDAGIDSHRTECNDATTALSNKQDQCDSATTNYETAFCQHRLSCGLLGACKAHEAQVYEDLLVDVRLAMGSRQEQFQTIRQIECLLELIASAIHSNTTIAPDQLDACDGDADFSHLTISIPSTPDLEDCPSPEHGDPVCPGLAQIAAVSDWASGQAVRRQVVVTMNEYYTNILSGPLPCDGSQTVAAESSAHGTSSNCEARDQCLVEVNTDCSVRAYCRDRCRSARNNYHWTEFASSGEVTYPSGQCSFAIGDTTLQASYQVVVTMNGYYTNILSGPLPCDGSQTVAAESAAHGTSSNCEARDQCLVEVNTDCSVRAYMRDRCRSARNNFHWTEFVSSGEGTYPSGHCSFSLGDTTPLLN